MMAIKYKTIKVESLSNYITLVTLNRPTVSNAFNSEMAKELYVFFEALSLESSFNTRCVIITGAGHKAFCSGGDLKERNGMSVRKWKTQHVIFERMIRSFIGCPVPIIGAINGSAFGGGCEIVAALDFSFAVSSAKFAQTEVKLGIIPGIGGTQNLARAIGEKKAKELILTGDIISAEQALNYGLINGIFSAEKLFGEVYAKAKTISSNGPIAVQQAKKAIQKGYNMSLIDGLAFEIEAYNMTIPTSDRIEGIAAFNEKRKPNFKGQ